MTSDAEARIVVGKGDCIFAGGAIRHEGGGGEDASLVELDDGAIDARGEAEVVCVDDETRRHRWETEMLREDGGP